MTPEELAAQQQGQLNEMFETVEWTPPKIEEPTAVETPVVAAVDDSVQLVPSVQEISLDAPVQVEAPVAVEEPVESVEDMLRRQLQELTMQISNPVHQVYPAAVVPEVKPVEAPAHVAPIVTSDFVPGNYLTEEELDQVVDNPKLIGVAIQRAQEDVLKYMNARAQGQLESQAQNINQMVQAAVQQQIMVTKAITEFYDGNQDLRPYAQFTQYVLAEVEKKYLGSATPKTYGEIFQETAETTRKRLGLPDPKIPTIERGKVVENKGAFAGSKKGGNARPTETKEIFDSNAADIMALEA